MLKITIPTIDVNDTMCKITNINFTNGGNIKSDDVLLSLETTKVNEDILAPEAGIVQYCVTKDESIKFGKIACLIFKNINEYQDYNSSKEEKTVNIFDEIKFTAKAQEFVKQYSIDLNLYKDQLKNRGVIKVDKLKQIVNVGNNKNIYDEVISNRIRVVIIGGGRGGEVVADILLEHPQYEVIGFVDDNPRENFNFYGIKIIHTNLMEFPHSFDREKYDAVIISIASDLNFRKKIFVEYSKNGIKFISAIDKTAKIGRNTKIGDGNIIGANTYIGTSTIIGDNNWIAASVNIDHHNIIADNNLFGPNFSSAGIVKVGSENKFGANSSISNYIEVGNRNIIMNNIALYSNKTNNNVIK